MYARNLKNDDNIRLIQGINRMFKSTNAICDGRALILLFESIM